MEKLLQEILNILDKVKSKRVVVIGDILLDEYIYGTVNKVSTGIKIPIVEKDCMEYRLGGAANVAANVAGLCHNTILIGRCGNDDAGSMIKTICEKHGVEFIAYPAYKTTVKQRIYTDNQQVFRLDSNYPMKSVYDELDDILQKLATDVIVIADYLYGIISQEVLDKIANYCERNNIILIISSRDLRRFKINSVPIIVANQKEWDLGGLSETDVEAFITRGEKGIKYISKTEEIEQKAKEQYPVNVSGAGDTVLAIIALLYGEDIDISILLRIANLAGGLAVIDKLTFVLTKQNLIDAIYEQWVNEDSINKIVDISLAWKIVSAWRNESKKIVFTNGCYDLLHLGHIKSFQYSKKFGDKLVVAVNSDESIKRLKGKGRPINNLEERVSTLAYLSMIDMVVPFYEDTAISVIEKIAPDTYIKGAEYKHRELLEAKYAKRVEYVPMIEGTSTTQLIKKITKAGENVE